jgi:hypothetical protein
MNSSLANTSHPEPWSVNPTPTTNHCGELLTSFQLCVPRPDEPLASLLSISDSTIRPDLHLSDNHSMNHRSAAGQARSSDSAAAFMSCFCLLYWGFDIETQSNAAPNRPCPVALLPFHARVVPVNWSIELTTDGAALIDPSLPASKSIGIFRTLEQQHIFLVHARLARTRRFLKSADTCVGD